MRPSCELIPIPSRGPSSRALAVSCCAAALITIITACGAPAEVSLQLRPALDENGLEFNTSTLQSLTITIANEEKSDERGIVLDREAQVELEPLTVDKSLPFTIDVWCCEDGETCGIDLVVMRGCTPEPLDFTGVVGTKVVPMQIFPVADERGRACPQSL